MGVTTVDPAGAINSPTDAPVWVSVPPTEMILAEAKLVVDVKL